MRRPLAVAAVAIVVVTVVPWGDFQGHTHWQKVGWIPFVSPPIRVGDVIANTLLFMPFGAAVVLNKRKGGFSEVAVAAAAAATLSLAGEAMQLYSHSRFPSATDLVCNTAGAAAAAYTVHRTRKRF